jgi:large subunit ribosomal protein L15
LNLHDIQKGTGKLRKREKLVGRGPGTGHGKSSGRGMKGFRARSGSSLPPWYEGGATPTLRRFPKRGFNNKRFRGEVEEVNVGALNRFTAGGEVGPNELAQQGLVTGCAPVKLLGKGTVDRKLTVKVHAASKSARSKLSAAGCTLVILEK